MDLFKGIRKVDTMFIGSVLDVLFALIMFAFIGFIILSMLAFRMLLLIFFFVLIMLLVLIMFASTVLSMILMH